MAGQKTKDHPNFFQYVAYCYGKRLPDSMRDWVAHDLADHGAVRRHLIRMAIPRCLCWHRCGCCPPRCMCTSR